MTMLDVERSSSLGDPRQDILAASLEHVGFKPIKHVEDNGEIWFEYQDSAVTGAEPTPLGEVKNPVAVADLGTFVVSRQ